MKVTFTLRYIISIVVIIIITMLGIQFILGEYLLNSEINDSVVGKSVIQKYKYKKAINRLQNSALNTALAFANHKGVIKAYNNPDTYAGGVQLLETVTPTINSIKEKLGLQKYNIHYHKPNGVSFVRTWRENAVRLDTIASFRKTVLQVQKTKLPLKAIELGRIGFAIRGIAPILDGDKYLGSVEMIYTPKDVLQLIADSNNKYINTFLVEKKYLHTIFDEINIKNSYPTSYGNYYVGTYDTDKINFNELVKQEKLDEAAKSKTIIFDIVKNHTILYKPVIDFQGVLIGYINLVD